ncbi:MAG: benzoyl-CoA-dihydrodiol lyase [Myxococcales bacterium]|nr:benzoyl-CoA-dihydrodiol lyase [Myxococcales bacterium]
MPHDTHDHGNANGPTAPLAAPAEPPVRFTTHPDRYRHWKLAVDAAAGVATLKLAVDKDAPLRPGYELKLNSYDLGVDIELADAVRRLRFEHPGVRCVVVTSATPKMFCAGANIRMLAQSKHGFKVNFCKFTNETRCEIEDATAHSKVRWIAALNGTAAGGGYELAEACAEIYLVDDGFSAVSLPEVPLLGVLPGTGGLTRLVDKRKVRRDVADVFCTKAEGFRLRDALKMRLVDGGWPKSKWEAGLAERTRQIVAELSGAGAAGQRGAGTATGIVLDDVEPTLTHDGAIDMLAWQHVTLRADHAARVAWLTVRGPAEVPPQDGSALERAGAATWSLRAFRELDAALLHLRFNAPKIGVVVVRTEGERAAVLAHDSALSEMRERDGHWLAREIQLHQARVLRRLDNMAKSVFAFVEPGHCFAGSLLEMAWAADRAYMLDDPDGTNAIELHLVNQGAFPLHNGMTRLGVRYLGEPRLLEQALALRGAIPAATAAEVGLVTRAPDDIDWPDETRLALEERVSFSPDALTGMEQNLRFAGPETAETKVFGRLSAWQNWIFQRPNAVGERGALVMFGDPRAAVFDYSRT